MVRPRCIVVYGLYSHHRGLWRSQSFAEYCGISCLYQYVCVSGHQWRDRFGCAYLSVDHVGGYEDEGWSAQETEGQKRL